MSKRRYPSGGGRPTRSANFGLDPDLMAGSKFRSQVEVLSVVDKGRRRDWTDAEKVRIGAQCKLLSISRSSF